MNPFFFGNSKNPLYGVYHGADNTSPDHGIILCAPLGQEYMRSHRAMRQLATMLSRLGVPVLRFDYHGTGDSAGELVDVTPTQWIEDINLAVDELKDTANVATVSIIGLRLGCLVATHACKDRKDVTRLILWDPVVSGAAYISELKTVIDEQPENKLSNFIAADGSLHFNGFAMSPAFQTDLQQLDLGDSYPANVESVLQIVSHESDLYTDLSTSWKQNSSFEYQHIDAPGDWNYVDDNGGILLPQPIIQCIVDQYKTREAA